MTLKFDRKGKRAKWLEARRAESSYNTRLRQVAKQVNAIIKGFSPDGMVGNHSQIIQALNGYAELIGPWAMSVAKYMVADVARRNAKTWIEHGKEMGQSLRSEIDVAPTGDLFMRLMNQQVSLIKSLPLNAAKQVHALTTEGMITSRRASSIAEEIMGLGAITERRARLIARTEVARTASNFTQARAAFAGSEGYIWRTSGDGDVRDTHQHMNGKFVRWDDPPKTDANLAPYHAGCGPNCRCYPDPVLPDL